MQGEVIKVSSFFEACASGCLRATFNLLLNIMHEIHLGNSFRESGFLFTLVVTVITAACLFIWSKSKKMKCRHRLDM